MMEYILLTAIFYDTEYKPRFETGRFPTVQACEARLEEIQNNLYVLPKYNIFGHRTTPTGLWRCTPMKEVPKGAFK